MAAGAQAQATTPEGMLTWSNQKITEPLTDLGPPLDGAALRNFRNIQRCMGDKPSAYIGDKQEPIISMAQKAQPICDEIYLQVMKQLTDNPSTESSMLGWLLLINLCKSVHPSEELSEFVRAFLEKAMVEAGGEHRAEPSARHRQSSVAVESELRMPRWRAARSSFAEKLPDLAAEAMELLRGPRLRAPSSFRPENQPEGEEISLPAATTLVSVHTEDGQRRELKVKTTHTLLDLYSRMLKTTSLHADVGFELFAADPNGGLPKRPLPPTMLITEAEAEVQAAGRVILFGRLNLGPGEELPVDDFPCARLTFIHATRQLLAYSIPLPEEQANTKFSFIGAALVAADKATFKKKRRGKGHDKFNAKVQSLKADLEGHLLGEGVVERYVPAAQLARRDRAEWARGIETLMETAGAAASSRFAALAADDEAGTFALVAQGKALTLMETLLADFQAYVWEPVRQVATEGAQFEGAASGVFANPGRRPQKVFQADPSNPDAEYLLLLTAHGLELRPKSGGSDGVKIAFQGLGLGGQYITGWRALDGDKLALGVDVFEASGSPAGAGGAEAAAPSGPSVRFSPPPRTAGGEYTPQHLTLGVPAGVARDVCCFLRRYAGEQSAAQEAQG